MANLLICYYKNKRVRRVKKVDLTEPGDNAFKFIDNITAIKMEVSLSVVIKKIYLPELKLKKRDSGHTEKSFLDIFINIEGNRFDASPFSIVRMPNLTTNIPSKCFVISCRVEVLK